MWTQRQEREGEETAHESSVRGRNSFAAAPQPNPPFLPGIYQSIMIRRIFFLSPSPPGWTTFSSAKTS